MFSAQPSDLKSIITSLRGDTDNLLKTLTAGSAIFMVTLADNDHAIEPFVILAATDKAEEMFGYLPGELSGKRLSLLIPKPIKEDHEQHMMSYSHELKNRMRGVDGLRRDGSLIPIQVSLSPRTYQGIRVVIATVVERLL